MAASNPANITAFTRNARPRVGPNPLVNTRHPSLLTASTACAQAPPCASGGGGGHRAGGQVPQGWRSGVDSGCGGFTRLLKGEAVAEAAAAWRSVSAACRSSTQQHGMECVRSVGEDAGS
jgi:hypothetical protein